MLEYTATFEWLTLGGGHQINPICWNIFFFLLLYVSVFNPKQISQFAMRLTFLHTKAVYLAY